MKMLQSFGLMVLTAGAELVGSYLIYLWVRENRSYWLALPALLFLFLFAYLLTLHEGVAGRTYAAYGGIYVFASLIWLWLVERQIPSLSDVLGVGIILIGASIIILNR